MTDTILDRMQIRELVEAWVIARDAADWDKFASLWHSGGTIAALWYQGSWEGYMQRSQEAWGKGLASVHYICGSDIEVAGTRGVSRANMVMFGRGAFDGAEYDLEVVAQFHDFFEKRDGRWGMVERCVVHVKDRMYASLPDAKLGLDQAVLASQPSHYKHLAYVNAKAGRPVKMDMPGLFGEAADKLSARASDWIAGKDLAPIY